MLNLILMLNTMSILMLHILNLKQGMMSVLQSLKTFFAKVYTPNWFEEFFMI